MSDVPVWNCEFYPLGEGGVDLKSITVGAKFGWKCHGDIPIKWEAGPPQLVFPKPEDQFSLAILQVLQQDANDAQFVVTTYKAGDHAPDFIRVMQAPGTSAEKGFEAVKPKWQTQSVLDPKQPPQPYGPFGPWSLSLPLWFVVALSVSLALIVFLVVRKVRKVSQRRRMLEDLKRHRTAMIPLHQFYRDARNLRRRLHNVKGGDELKAISEDLDRDFRLFVLRRSQIPTLDWSNRAVLEDLRRRHRKTYRAAALPLRKTLRELGKLKARGGKIELQDVEQLHIMSLETAEKLDSAEVPK